MSQGKNARKRAIAKWKAENAANIAKLRKRVSKITGPQPVSLFAPKRIKRTGNGVQVMTDEDRIRSAVKVTLPDGTLAIGTKLTVDEANRLLRDYPERIRKQNRWWVKLS